jgi:hypothetical protein
MKKTIFGLFIMAAVLFSSCKKTHKSLPLGGGSWTLKGTTYYADGCTDSASILYAFNGPGFPGNNDYSECVVLFGSYPVTSGTYTLVSNAVEFNVGLTSSQAFIISTQQPLGSFYYSTDSGAITATVSPTGKISVSGSNIQVIGNPLDSGILSFSLTQTN